MKVHLVSKFKMDECPRWVFAADVGLLTVQVRWVSLRDEHFTFLVITVDCRAIDVDVTTQFHVVGRENFDLSHGLVEELLILFSHEPTID